MIAAQQIFNRCNGAEETVLLASRARRKVQGGGRAGACSASKGQPPQPVDGNRRSGSIEQLSLELAGDGIEDKNLSAAELPNQNVVAIDSKVARGLGNPPWCIEPMPPFETQQEATRRGEDIDVSQAGAVDLIVPRAIAGSKCDVQIPADVLNVERSEVFGDPLILKRLLP